MHERSGTWSQDAARLLRRWQDQPAYGMSAKLNAAIGYEQAGAYGRAIEKALPELERQWRLARVALQGACDDLNAAEAAWRAARAACSRLPGTGFGAYASNREREARAALTQAQRARNEAADAAWQAEQRLGLLRSQLDAVSALDGPEQPLTVLVLELRR